LVGRVRFGAHLERRSLLVFNRGWAPVFFRCFRFIPNAHQGKLADLVVFDTSNLDIACAAGIDPLTAVVRFSEVRDIEMVIIDGVNRKRGGKLLPVMYNGQEFSWDEVRFSLMRSQKDISARYRACSIEKSRDMVMNMLGLDPATLVGE
jgi:cytosine/adenosine deaminase-related metal-dependent hydrolase